MNKNLAAPIALLVLVVMFIALCNPIAMVGVGERGVKVTLGRVDDSKIYTEGIHFVMPFISKIKTLIFDLFRKVRPKHRFAAIFR